MFVGNGLGMNCYYSKYIGLDIKNFWYQIGNISKIILLCLLIGYGLNAYIISSSKLVFLLKILGYTVIYGVMIYFMAMSPGEKEKVRGIGQKFIWTMKIVQQRKYKEFDRLILQKEFLLFLSLLNIPHLSVYWSRIWFFISIWLLFFILSIYHLKIAQLRFEAMWNLEKMW